MKSDNGPQFQGYEYKVFLRETDNTIVVPG